MIPALVIALSVPGVWLAAWLLRQPTLARELVAEPDDPDVISFGGDYRGLV